MTDTKRNQKTQCLIVSYSYSGEYSSDRQGHTGAYRGDRYEIYPWQPYPMAFPELLNQVKKRSRTWISSQFTSGCAFTGFLSSDFCWFSELVRDDRTTLSLLAL